MAIDCLSLSFGHGHRLSLSLSPDHGHRLSIFLLFMAIDCLSLPPLIVEICSLSASLDRGDLLSLWSWGSVLSLFWPWALTLSLALGLGNSAFSLSGHDHGFSLSYSHGHSLSLSLSSGHGHWLALSSGHDHWLSLGRRDLLSLSLLVVEICSFSFSHSLWVRATCSCPSLDHGHLFSPSVFLWEIHTFFSLSVGHKHLLLFSSGHCHLFSIFFSPLTTAGCSLLFPQKKHLLSLFYLPSFSFLCYLNLSTSVSVRFLAAMTCINLSWLHSILIAYATGASIPSGRGVLVSHCWAFFSCEREHILYRMFSQILNEPECFLTTVYHLPCDSYSFLVPWNTNLTSVPTPGNEVGTRYPYLWWC